MDALINDLKLLRTYLLHILRWPVSWLLDRRNNLSTSKIMAFGIYAAYVTDHSIPPLVCAMLITAAFGYSAWKDFVEKNRWTNTASESFAFSRKHDITESVIHSIAEKRDVIKGFDPSEPKLDPNHKEP